MNIQFIEDHYKKNRSKLVKRMYFRTGSEAAAEDIVQTTYELAIRYMNGFRGGVFDAWISTILNNALREYQNAEKGYVHKEEDEEEETTEDTSCPHLPARVMKEIHELIDTKSVDQMEVLKLHFEMEYSAQDISHITTHSYAKARQIIHRFQNEIKELYGEEEKWH